MIHTTWTGSCAECVNEIRNRAVRKKKNGKEKRKSITLVADKGFIETSVSMRTKSVIEHVVTFDLRDRKTKTTLVGTAR